MEENPCSICLENLENGNIRGMDCGHIFHANCIGTWTKKSDQCPMCRQYIGTDQTESPVSPILEMLVFLHFVSNI